MRTSSTETFYLRENIIEASSPKKYSAIAYFENGSLTCFELNRPHGTITLNPVEFAAINAVIEASTAIQTALENDELILWED